MEAKSKAGTRLPWPRRSQSIEKCAVLAQIARRAIFKSTRPQLAIRQAMDPRSRVTAHVFLASMAAGLGLLAAVACGDSSADAPAKSGVFGGAGGIPPAVALGGQLSKGGAGAGADSGGSAPLANSCADTPQGKLALVDDFDDGDSAAALEPNREGYWFTIHDDTAGSITPAPDFVPVAGGVRGTLAAHITVESFSAWGAALIVNISHKQALRCPYNASAFKGLRFVARGHGAVRVQAAMPGVIDKEYGGTCDPAQGQICNDGHGSFVTLTDQYQVVELPWSDFQQRNYGTPVAFEPKTILALQFQFEAARLPIDFWLDDVAFWDGVPAASGAGGAGSGGAPDESASGGANAGQGGT